MKLIRNYLGKSNKRDLGTGKQDEGLKNLNLQIGIFEVLRNI